MKRRIGGLSRGTRMAGAVALAIPLFLQVTPAVRAGTGPATPVAEIVNPENLKIFRPGQVPVVDGNAFAGLGVNAVKLEFWLANKMERAVLAECGSCKTSTGTYWTYAAEGLLPGYYVVKAYAVDNSGNFSSAAQRGFVYGLQTVQTPTPPALPPAPTAPGGPTLPAPTVDQPPNVPLPGAEGPVTIGGRTSDGDQRVHVREQSLGPLGSVRSDDDGTWEISPRLPSGTYRFRVRATESDGDRSAWSRIYRVQIDADRPLLNVATPADSLFTPVEPVAIEGTLFDERAPAAVRVEYWLLNKVVHVGIADCIACGDQELVWRHRPQGLSPGYYHVRISAYDRAGNPSHNATTSFLYAL